MGSNSVFSFASLVVPSDQWGQFHHNVKFFNVRTNQPVTIPMKVDTGGHNVTIGPQYAQQLGVNLKSGQPIVSMGIEGSVVNQYTHRIKMQIGSLKPILVPVSITETPVHSNLLGWPGVLEQYQLDIAKTSLKITESQKLAMLAMSRVGSNFRRRI